MQWYNLYYVFLPQLPQSGNSLTNLTRVLSLEWNLSDARPCYVDNINLTKREAHLELPAARCHWQFSHLSPVLIPTDSVSEMLIIQCEMGSWHVPDPMLCQEDLNLW